MKTENQNMGCPQRNSPECEKYAEASSIFHSENGGKGSAAAGPNTSWKRFTKSKIPSFISHANQTSDLRICLQIIFSLFMANRCQQFFLVCFHPLSRGMHGGRYQTA